MDDLQALLAEIVSGDDRRAEAAVHGLSACGTVVLPALRLLLASPDPDARWWATWALSEIRDPQVPALLKEGLSDPELSVRQAAALALRQQPNPEAIPDLITMLESAPQSNGAMPERDPVLAHLAAAALIAAGDAAVPGLIRTLENGSQAARALAARCLAAIGDKRAIPALYAALDSDSAVVEYWAAEGLEKMGVGMTFLKPE
jgi:HEAT repeat protein